MQPIEGHDSLLARSLQKGRLVELDTNEVSSTEALDYWREMVLRLFADVEISSSRSEGFFGRMSSLRQEGLRITQVQAAGQSVCRRHADAREDYEDAYFAVLMLGGTQQLEQDGRRVILRPGDFAIYDGARPHKLAFSPRWSEIILNIPRASLRAAAPGIADKMAVRLMCEHGLPRVLRDFLRGLGQELGSFRLDETEALSQHAIGLIASAMGPAMTTDELARPVLRATGLPAVKLVIDSHLRNPSLDAEQLARLVGLSPRYLNKLFAEEQTSLMRYVWQRRLELCSQALRDPALAQLRITDIALQWGFNDLSHFSRAFRDRYGVSPRDWRGSDWAGAV